MLITVIVALHQMLSEMNKMKRLLFLYLGLSSPRLTETLQVTNCKETSNIGFPLPTHQRTMTSFGRRTTLGLLHGSLRVMH